MPLKLKWTTEEDDKLKELVLNSQLGYKQISQALSRTPSACWNRSWELGLKKKFLFKKHTVDENFWAVPNFINSYWAGFCAADACLQPYKSGNGGRLILMLASKDANHVEQFKKDTNFLGNIELHPSKTGMMTKVRISSSKQWFDDLCRNFSVIPRKTYRLSPPPHLSTTLQFAYLIGYTDGDGSIVLKDGKEPSFSFVSSSYNILQWIYNLVNNYLPVEKHSFNKNRKISTVRPDGKCFRFGFTGIRALVFFDFLKDFPVPKLARKWNNPKVLELLERKKQEHPDFFKLTPELQLIKDRVLARI